MDISDWRRRIDGIDEKLVEQLNQWARAAAAIGKLKRAASEPVYQPQRGRLSAKAPRGRCHGARREIHISKMTYYQQMKLLDLTVRYPS